MLFAIIFFVILYFMLRSKKSKSLTSLDLKQIDECVKIANEAFENRVRDMKIEQLINPPQQDKNY